MASTCCAQDPEIKWKKTSVKKKKNEKTVLAVKVTPHIN
jgi:hypothetical protein